jgi:LPS export ABC transporter protein LptC
MAVLAVAGCDKQKVTGPPMVYKGPLMETTNVRTLFSDSAKLKFQLTAPLEQRFENNDLVYPKGMVVTFYSADGKKNVVNTLKANYGKMDNAKNLIIMRSDVRVVNVPQEQRLNTEELFYDRTKQLIYTDSAMFVKVTTPTENLEGYGLTANQSFSRYSIKKPVGQFAAPQAAAPAATPAKTQPKKPAGGK